MVSCADFIRFVDADFVCTREVKRTSRRPLRPPSLPLVSVNTIMMQEVDKRFYERVGAGAGVRSWKTSLVLWSRRIMACSLNGIESSRRILNNGVGVNRMLLAEAIPTWYPLWQLIHMINLR